MHLTRIILCHTLYRRRSGHETTPPKQKTPPSVGGPGASPRAGKRPNKNSSSPLSLERPECVLSTSRLSGVRSYGARHRRTRCAT